MEKWSKQLEYYITSLVLLGLGLLFYFVNAGLNTVTALHFSLFQIMQGVLILIWAVVLTYQTSVERRWNETPEEERTEREPVDSVNATMILVVVTVLVVGYYMFTMKINPEIGETVAPLHMVICVVTFIGYACVERWWSMQLSTNPSAASMCNLMVLNKGAVIALMLDMITSFTGLFSVRTYVDYVILAIWGYVCLMAVISVGVKLIRHRDDMSFRIYIWFPVYSGGEGENGALAWLERNTGISMRSLWSLKFVKMVLPACGFMVLVILWLSTGIVQVEPWQQGALYRFGRLSEQDILEPGLHFKLPIPFEDVKLYNIMQPQSMVVGYEGDVSNKNNLWTRPHEGEEQTLLLGDGKELVAINLKITYRIDDLYAYLTNYSSPELVLNAKGYEIVMGETNSTDIDTVISEDRSQLSHRIEEQLKEYAEQAGLGLEVMNVTLASIHPPVAIADIYQSVVSAGIQKKTAILTAEGEALVARERAEAEKQLAVNEAGIQRDERVSTAKAEVETYNAGIEAYIMDPVSYRMEKYLESIEKALAGQKKYLVSPDVDVNNLYANYGQSWFLPSQGEEAGETEGQSGQENTAGTGDASSTETSTGEGS